MESSVVCGVDGSKDSATALAFGARIAERLGARLVLAHVVDPVGPAHAATGIGAGEMPLAILATTPDEQIRAGEGLLAHMAEAAGVEHAKQRVVSGLAAERLAALAEDEGAELIVVGSRGRGAFKAAFLGSVSTSLIGISRVPVVVVPAGASELGQHET
jgi:nucleotide-binding universal stress UspA family protein